MLKREKGITLIALVITIIVLLILAGITLNLVIGENGIIANAQNSKEIARADSVEEEVKLWNMANEMSAYTNKKVETFDEILQRLQTQALLKPEEVQEIKDQANTNQEIMIGNRRISFRLARSGANITTGIIGDGSYIQSKGINSPKITADMTPVIFDETTKQINVATNENQWYDYTAQTGTTENGGTSRWANVKTADDSMWVWIPRYTYKITSNEHTKQAGTIAIKFSQGITDDTSDGYRLHPAFTFGSQELPGIWVAKFEMSGETSNVASEPGDVATSATVKMVSKPERISWRNIGPDNIFSNILNYDTTKNSHMMKNIEWGAVVYLTHSAYGRNGTEVTINNNSDFMTGYGAETISAGQTNNTGNIDNQWLGTYGKRASSTGNSYGIYDLYGAGAEFVAGYVENEWVQTSFPTLASADPKYKDVYIKGTSDTENLNYEANSAKYGDAVYETSETSSPNDRTNSWNGNYSMFPVQANSVFIRGGLGIFGFIPGLRAGSLTAFRAVLAF